jgi:hypothetical protein
VPPPRVHARRQNQVSRVGREGDVRLPRSRCVADLRGCHRQQDSARGDQERASETHVEFEARNEMRCDNSPESRERGMRGGGTSLVTMRRCLLTPATTPLPSLARTLPLPPWSTTSHPFTSTRTRRADEADEAHSNAIDENFRSFRKRVRSQPPHDLEATLRCLVRPTACLLPQSHRTCLAGCVS